jgi:cation-transporting ATPase F
MTASGLSLTNAHHGLAAHEVVLLLSTDPHRGLGPEEASRRLSDIGPNTLPPAARRGVILRVLSQFHHPLVYVLVAAGVITAVLREFVDSAVIFGVVAVNAVIGFVQESKAEAALEGLRSMVRTRARVVRDGRVLTVDSADVVPGDLVTVGAGDRVPADLRLVRLTGLCVDESALTGESVPVVKDEVVLPADTAVADRRNMLYSGTLVTSGSGAGVVVATGAESELGRIHRLVASARTVTTPLTAKLAAFSRVLTVVILTLAGVSFGVGVMRGENVAAMFTAAIALAVGAIPEGLPAAVTITLAIGVGRMARRRAVVRRLPAVETLGSTTVICSDKTGTLTENEMTVVSVWTPDAAFTVTGSGYAPRGAIEDGDGVVITASAGGALWWCLTVGALCNDAALAQENGRWTLTGDPTEGALLAATAKGGVDRGTLVARYPRIATVPFSAERQYMATLHDEAGTGERVVLVKGSSERILALCRHEMSADGLLAPLDAGAVRRAADELAGHGLRVLATAIRRDPRPSVAQEARSPEDAVSGPLVFTGLQAMSDPPRPSATAAIRACHTAGIAVKMITGDHAVTARTIATRLGLLSGSGGVLTGRDLEALPDAEYPDAVDGASVFARVSPEQKLRLVRALQARGHVVAMTGDGVNDAPALRQADIGVAMGRGGTEVAKDAADMVLTDDDFATVEAAVEEGRAVFDNLVKFIVWTLPTNMAEGLVLLVAILLGATLPILPTQILWINMTTAVALGLMLAFEPQEAGIMTRPPRDPARPLLTGALIARILLVSALLVGGSWWLFVWEQATGATVAEARTAALNLFVVVMAAYLLSCRTLTGTAWRIGPLSNRWLLVGVAVQGVGQAAITYLPTMNHLFHTAPITGATWLRILAAATLAVLVVALDKRLHRRPA